jgi:hypothetical protein
MMTKSPARLWASGQSPWTKGKNASSFRVSCCRSSVVGLPPMSRQTYGFGSVLREIGHPASRSGPGCAEGDRAVFTSEMSPLVAYESDDDLASWSAYGGDRRSDFTGLG